MIYPVEFIPEATKDYRDLDGIIQLHVDKKMEELSHNPFLGDRLGHKFNIDLTGFFKIYISNKNYRIVYRLLTPEKI